MQSNSDNGGDDERLRIISLYFILFAAMLAFVMVSSKYLHDCPTINSFVSEASLTLLTGIFVGGLVHVLLPDLEPETTDNNDGDGDGNGDGDGETYEQNVLAHSLLSFSPNIFFMALLPPILFNSGYQLRRELFCRHIKPILMFACLGTTLCALTTGLLLYAVSAAGWLGDTTFAPTMLELLTFGALTAATDTVSILGVLQAKQVDPHLFYLVVGESALNDAVALVLFYTFVDLLKSGGDESRGIAVALKVSGFFINLACAAIGSPLLGIVFSFATALMFKHVDLRQHPSLELPLYMLLMYTPFVVAECFHLSGIVAIFFSGISARRYIAPNVSAETEKNAEVLFKLASYMAETCIFLELGLSLFGLPNSFNWIFIGWALLASLMGRAVGIYPLSFIYNWSLKEKATPETTATIQVRMPDTDGLMRIESRCASSDTSTASPSRTNYHINNNNNNHSPLSTRSRRKTPEKRKDRRISLAMTHVLWFAGLRGAVAYACVRKFPNLFGHADEFTAAVMFIVLFSIIIMGGATESLLRTLQIEMGVNEEDYMTEWRRRRKFKGILHLLGALCVLGVGKKQKSAELSCL